MALCHFAAAHPPPRSPPLAPFHPPAGTSLPFLSGGSLNILGGSL